MIGIINGHFVEYVKIILRYFIHFSKRVTKLVGKIAKTFYIEAMLTWANHMHCNSILSNDIDSAACSIPFTKLLSHVETLIEE